MRKKRRLLSLCAMAFCAGTFAIALNAKTRFMPKPARQSQARAIPEAVIYSILFHYVVDVKAQAEEVARSGKDASSLSSHFRRAANLDDRQARILDEIATEVVREVESQNGKAREAIDKFKSQFPGGKVPKGVKLPPPPPELREMQQEKNAILLLGHDKLRAALGEGGYSNLTAYIRAYIAPQITITSIYKQ